MSYKNLEYMRPHGLEVSAMGHKKAAEGLVAWNNKTKPGTTFTRKTSWGLSVVATAGKPYIKYYLNQDALASFIDNMGPGVMIHFEGYGIGVISILTNSDGVMSENHSLAIYLPLPTEVVLHIYRPGQHDEVLLGVLVIQDDGFEFFTAAEEKAAQEAIAAKPPASAPAPTTSDTEMYDIVDDSLSPEELEELIAEAEKA